MSTSAAIAIKNPNETVDFTRVNFDAYPERLGLSLTRYFNSEELARKLINGGEIREVCGDDVEYYSKPNPEAFSSGAKSVDISTDFTYFFENNEWIVFKGESDSSATVEDYLKQLY